MNISNAEHVRWHQKHLDGTKNISLASGTVICLWSTKYGVQMLPIWTEIYPHTFIIQIIRKGICSNMQRKLFEFWELSPQYKGFQKLFSLQKSRQTWVPHSTCNIHSTSVFNYKSSVSQLLITIIWTILFI